MQKYLQYLNDSTLKNVHWSLCTGLFNKRDVGRIEREFLDVLDFELRITETEILTHYESIMLLRRPPPTPPRLRISSSAARPPLTRYNSSGSSSASSMDVDEDSPASTESGSLPPTPSSAEQDDTTVYVRSLSKHSPEGDSDADSARSRYSTGSTGSIVVKEPVAVRAKGDPTASGHHPRLSSAFNLLRNIHKPHFHHSSSSSS